MKTFIICAVAAGGLVGFSGCESVEERQTTTTTTEETTVSRPSSSTVETQTVRTY